MSESDIGKAIFDLLRASFDAGRDRLYINLIIYTPFGIVRGKVSRVTTAPQSSSYQPALPHQDREQMLTSDLLELHDVSVEHYSNHLPSANFDRLYVNTRDIQGIAFER